MSDELELAGKSFHFAGRLAKLTDFPYQDFPVVAREHGATVHDDLNADVEYLVVVELDSTSGIEKKAAKLNEKGASIQTIAAETFLEMLLPATEQVRALLVAGEVGHRRLDRMLDVVWRFDSKYRNKVTYPTYDCQGIDLHGINITGARTILAHCSFDHANLSGVVLSEQTATPAMTSTNLDGARLYAFLGRLENCSCIGADFTYSTLRGGASGCDFTRANLESMWFERANLLNCNFQESNLNESSAERIVANLLNFKGATLREAECEGASFQGADFTGADLSEADLRKTHFQRANLSGAKFLGANLVESDLSHSIVDGADFTGAELAAVNWTGVDLSNAIGVSVGPQKAVTVGAKTKELSRLAHDASLISFVVDISTGTGQWRIDLESGGQDTVARWYKADQSRYSSANNHTQFPSLQDAFVRIAGLLDGSLQPETLQVKGSKTGVSPKVLKSLVLDALYESFGGDVPDAKSIDQIKQQKQDELDAKGSSLLKLLSSSAKDAVGQWNRQIEGLEGLCLQSSQLAEVTLDGIQFDKQKFDQSNFDNSSLKKASLRQGTFTAATFRSADLSEVTGGLGTYDRADLTKANLTDASFNWSSLREANLTGADLTRTNFEGSYLQGANLSKAIIDDESYKEQAWTGRSGFTRFKDAQFDESTRFPGKRFPCGLIWKGKGLDPRQKTGPATSKTGTLTLEEFMQVLRATSLEKSRISNAVTMLKKERFQLFAELTDDQLIGIVKSQTDADLVYSCRLANTGDFSCCTQNLKPCGGLRGELCKHLLVLMIGLAQRDEQNAGTLFSWILASQSQKPTLDKTAMSETLLRYKSAEAGEIDWRPTETIPEDYFAI